MLRRLDLVITEVSENRIASIIRVRRIGELKPLAVTRNRSMLRRNTNVVPNSPILVTLMTEAIRSFETSVL
jgi:hypothetical protein